MKRKDFLKKALVAAVGGVVLAKTRLATKVSAAVAKNSKVTDDDPTSQPECMCGFFGTEATYFYDKDLCLGGDCWECIDVCPVDAFDPPFDDRPMCFSSDIDGCIDCDQCVMVCPSEAIIYVDSE